MSREELEELFKKHDDEFRNYHLIKNPPSKRRDLCAFILLDKLVPGDGKIVVAAEHDEIFLGVELDDLAKVASEDDVITLCRCGVSIWEDSLRMYA